MRDFKLLLTFVIFLFSFATISADETCDLMFQSAKSKFEKKDYEGALKAFRSIEKGRCSSYYNVSYYINQCNEAIRKKNEQKKSAAIEQTVTAAKTEKPSKGKKTVTLSVKDTSVVANFTDTVISIPVKSNSEWSVQLASEYWLNATKSNDSLVIVVDRNPYDTERNSIFEIRSEVDTTKYQTITLFQKPAEKILEVAYNKLEDEGAGGTKIIDVNCTLKNWRIEYAPEWTKCHKINGNKALSIQVDENMTTGLRNDSIVLIAGELRTTIKVEQKTLAPSQEALAKMKASISNVTFRNNMYSNGAMGVAIGINMQIENMNGSKAKCVIRFADNKHNPLKTTQPSNYKDADNNIIAFQQFHPRGNSYSPDDFQIHMPYDQLHTEGLVTCQVEIIEPYTGTVLAKSDWYQFAYGIYVPQDTFDNQDAEGAIIAMKISSSVDWDIESVSGLATAEIKEDSLIIDVKSHTFTKDTISIVTISDRSKRFRRTITIHQNAYDELAKINTGADIIHTNMTTDALFIPRKESVDLIINCDHEWEYVNRYSKYGNFIKIKRKKNVLTLSVGNTTRPQDLHMYIDIVTTDEGKVLRIPIILQGTGVME